MQVGVVDQRAEGVGVGVAALAAIVPTHVQAVIETLLAPRHPGFPQAVGVALFERGDLAATGRAAAAFVQGHRRRPRQQRTHPQRAVGAGVQTEQRERVGVAGLHQCLDLRLGQH